MLLAGADAWLDASMEPEVQRVVLLDGPAVLGWERWRDIGLRYGLGLVSAVLSDAIAAGLISEQPVDPLAHARRCARRGGLYVARAPDPVKARKEMGAVIHQLITALCAQASRL